jgi:hypothetical protein
MVKYGEKFAKPVTEHGVWRNRTMQELTERHETRDLVANTNMKRLKGQGNVITMEQFIWLETKNYLLFINPLLPGTEVKDAWSFYLYMFPWHSI